MTFSLGGHPPAGSPQQIHEAVNIREQSATNVIARQQQMIVKDTLDVPLSKMQGQSDLHRYYYQSAENKPKLPMYLEVFLTRPDRQEETWPQAFKELAGKLSKELKAFLKKEMEKPANQRDPSFNSLKRSLEFAARGLDWIRGCKGVKVKINDEERKKVEKAQTKATLDFYRELVQASNKVAKSLPPFKREREYLYHMGMRIPPIISAVGAKRERIEKNASLSKSDKIILKEIAELRNYMGKNLGEKHPMITTFLIDYLEVIHQLSYPQLAKPLFKMLHFQSSLAEMEYSALNRLLGPFQALTQGMAALGGVEPFVKETETYLGVMLLCFLSLLDQGEKEKDFTFFLKLALLMASHFLKSLGKELMQGFLVSEKSAEWMGQSMLGLSCSLLFIWMKFRKLHEKESDELFDAFKPLFAEALQSTARFVEEKEGYEELKTACGKLSLSLAQGNRDDFVQEMGKALNRMGLHPLEIEKTVKGLRELDSTIRETLLEDAKDKNRLAFSARSA